MKLSNLCINSEQWILKTFEELTNYELYCILHLRNSIFIVDQNCAFEDIDGKDLNNCYHLFCILNKQVIAYAIIFEPNIIYSEPCISRVCTSLNFRGKGIGKKLMKITLDKTSILFSKQSIRIEAQLYLKKFYEGFGFKTIGEPYVEDGIEHIQMLK